MKAFGFDKDDDWDEDDYATRMKNMLNFQTPFQAEIVGCQQGKLRPQFARSMG